MTAEAESAPGAPMIVTVIGAVSGNGGDAAILIATFRSIERHCSSKLVVNVVDANPDITASVAPWVNKVASSRPDNDETVQRDRRLRRRVFDRLARAFGLQLDGPPDRMIVPNEAALDLIAEADVVVYSGGTSLVEHYETGSKFGAMRAATLLGRPLVLATQSLGPFTTAATQNRARTAAARASAVLLRDTRSEQHLVEIGAEVARSRVLPDVVFALASLPAEPRPQPGTRSPKVAISVRSWSNYGGSNVRGQRNYESAVAGVTTWLVEDQHAQVTFLSTCQGQPTYWIDDSECAQRIHDSLPSSVRASVTVRRDSVPPESLRDEYGHFDVVIATRMHAAILAFCAGTPVVAVAYEFKTTELFRSFDMGELVVQIDDVSAGALIERVSSALGQLETLQRRVSEGVIQRSAEAVELGRYVVDAARSPAN